MRVDEKNHDCLKEGEKVENNQIICASDYCIYIASSTNDDKKATNSMVLSCQSMGQTLPGSNVTIMGQDNNGKCLLLNDSSDASPDGAVACAKSNNICFDSFEKKCKLIGSSKTQMIGIEANTTYCLNVR